MIGESTTTAGEELYTAHQRVIDSVIAHVCSKAVYFDDPEDFRSWVLMKIVEDDFAILRKFQGRSNIRTYLSVVIQRLLLDYRTSKWGKYRPSAQAKRAGALAILLDQLIGRDGHDEKTAIEIVVTNHGVNVSVVELEALVAKLPRRLRRRMVTEEALSDVASSNSADDDVKERERQALADRVSNVMRRLMGTLETQDRLILTLIFADGRTRQHAAAVLSEEPKRFYRRVDGLLRDLRRGLEAEGLNAPDMLEMLQTGAVTIEWELGTKENA